MQKRDEAKKTAEKALKPGRAVKAQTADAKASATTQKGQATRKKPARMRTGTTFRLEAPQAAKVFVAGCFNEWSATANPLERDEEGTWSCVLAIAPGEHEYRFVVDGVWRDDPANASRRWNEFGTQNCILTVQA